MKKQNIKLIQWGCRLIPALNWGLYLLLLLIHGNDTNNLFRNPVYGSIFILVMFLYLFLVFLVLPGLIFGDKYRGFKFYFISWFMAGATAGVIPVILYWIKVDKKLSDQADS